MALSAVNNIFNFLPPETGSEQIEEILKSKHLRVERIISEAAQSPTGFWYDQQETEWVMLLTGEAALQLEGERDIVVLKSGDYLTIHPHQKHRIEWTAAGTLWLCIFYND